MLESKLEKESENFQMKDFYSFSKTNIDEDKDKYVHVFKE